MRAALFGISYVKIETHISSKKITSLLRLFITDSWLRNAYLIYTLSRGTVVILFLGNMCLNFNVQFQWAAGKENNQALK